MDSVTSTDDLLSDVKLNQENVLLEIIKEICTDTKSTLSPKLLGKVNRIIADCDLTHYSSLHKFITADESTSTVLGFVRQASVELTFDEQAQFNTAVIQKIRAKIPAYTSELDTLKHTVKDGKKYRKNQIKALQESLDEKLTTLQEQEGEKVELMMEWLNHKLQDISQFNNNSTELLCLKSRFLELQSKILHLGILQNIFTETNQSIKAYSEVHKDLEESIQETKERIKKYKEIIESDHK